MSAPAQNRIAPFTASREQPCGSPWACDPGTVATGTRGAYVGVTGGFIVVCSACREALENGATLDDETTDGAADVAAGGAPEPDGQADPAPAGDVWESTPAQALVLPPMESASSADLVPWNGPLCACTSRASGFTRDVDTGRWVHTECRRPTLRYTADTHAGQLAGKLRAANPGPAPAVEGQPDGLTHDDLTTDNDHHDDPGESAGDEPAGDAPRNARNRTFCTHSRPACAECSSRGIATDPDDVKACDCARVTKRAKITLDDAGRPVHGNCGGVLREQHRHLAAHLTQPETSSQEQPAQESSDDQPATHPGAAVPERPAADRGDVVDNGVDGADGAATGDTAPGDAGAGDAGAGDAAPENGVHAAHPETGQPVGGADRAVRPHEGRGGPDGERAQGSDQRDQGGGEGGGPAGNGHRDPQPVPAHPAAAAGEDQHQVRRDQAQGDGSGDLRQVRVSERDLGAGTPAVATFAQFWAQPLEDDAPTATFAQFWTQPLEDDDNLSITGNSIWASHSGGAVGRALGESVGNELAGGVGPVEGDEDEPLHVQVDRAQVEQETDYALQWLGAQYGGEVTGLVVAVEGEQYPRVVTVARP